MQVIYMNRVLILRLLKCFFSHDHLNWEQFLIQKSLKTMNGLAYYVKWSLTQTTELGIPSVPVSNSVLYKCKRIYHACTRFFFRNNGRFYARDVVTTSVFNIQTTSSIDTFNVWRLKPSSLSHFYASCSVLHQSTYWRLSVKCKCV